MKNTTWCCCLGLVLLLAACAPNHNAYPVFNASVHPITAEELLARIQAGNNLPFLLDVRQPDELQGELGQLPGAVNIPLGQLFARLQEIPKDRDVVVICRSGNRSLLAQAEMRKRGFTRLFNLQGGMQALRAYQAKHSGQAPAPAAGGEKHAR